MSFYITQQKKEELEAKIAELEKVYPDFLKNQLAGTLANRALVNQLQEILSEAIVLPVEESWKATVESDEDYEHYIENIVCFPTKFPNGVIIKPK